jgi:predicted nuclease of predicted toxin-antitoxin system
MKLLLDMNLSPLLATLLLQGGHEAVHWSTLGDPRASDRSLLEWAAKNNYVVLTHDLDFGAILAATQATFPSVIQIRTQDVSPEKILPLLLAVLEQQKTYISAGALLTIDEGRKRVRILPMGQ